MNRFIKECLEPNGRLSNVIQEYEFRQTQLEMARDIALAIAVPGTILMAEAGTGTGKSLAYLIPVAAFRRRAIISTGTKNLQEQLIHKDIPLLNRFVEKPLRAILLKGRGNYLCLRRFYWFLERPEFETAVEKRHWSHVRQWANATDTGDKSELSMLQDNSTLWNRICSRREECSGSYCGNFRNCYVMRVKIRAQEADVIVVNHHLYFADAIFAKSKNGSTLTDAATIVFDEAHLLEEIASQYLGVHLSQSNLMDFLKMVTRWKPDRKDLQGVSWALEKPLQSLEEGIRLFFGSMPSGEGRFDLSEIMKDNTVKMGNVLSERLELFGLDLQKAGLIPEEFVSEWRVMLREMSESLRLFLTRSEPGMAWWGEHSFSGNSLHAVPVDISKDFAKSVIKNDCSVIMTSATLTADNSFDYFKKRLGLTACETRIYPSVFEFDKQGILYLPVHLPNPNDSEFYTECATEILRILSVTSGRAFVLTTSYAGLNKLETLLSGKLPYRLLVQGEMPKNALTQEFRYDKHSVLLATVSFWQGVDIPGESLSAVIIDKLPFASPGDPLTKARLQHLRDNGVDPFREFQIPSAVMMLKQGIGRLIRTRSDRGLVAILDHRIVRQRYGYKFIQSIPGFSRTSSIEDVRKFFTCDFHQVPGPPDTLSEP